MRQKERVGLKKVLMWALSMALLLGILAPATFAQTPQGEYELDADLSCFVSAMGGVEFGAPLLKGTQLIVDAQGKESLKLTLSKSSVTIYSITCDTFVDAAPSYVTDDRGVTSGTIGIYDQDGILRTDGVTYTLSDDTALNASNQAVHYVDTITFPIDSRRDSYGLTLYINSNVMGVQFCNANDQATAATYAATLSVSWGSLTQGAGSTSAPGMSTGDSPEQPAPADQGSAAHDASPEEMDGLSIYRADDTQGAEGQAAASIVVRELGLNTKALAIFAIISTLIFVAGAVLFVVTKRGRKDEA